MLIPDLSEEQLAEIESAAEVKLYRKLRDELPDRYLILFQVGWISSRGAKAAQDGEIDFLICDPNRGFLALEVKGGGVSFDPISNQWSSTNRHGQVNPIKDPIKQALKAKYSVYEKIVGNSGKSSQYFENAIRGHAVFFPDIKYSNSLVRTDCPKEILGTSEDLADLTGWLDKVFSFWSRGSVTKPGQAGLDEIKQIFAKVLTVTPLKSSRVSVNEARILQLTNDQLQILNFISSRRRAVIHGGAGTGKTVLAVQKARELAAQGFQTLLTCYNRPLVEYLQENLAGIEGVTVLSIHQLARRYVEVARKASGRDFLLTAKSKHPDEDLWDVQMPLAMWDAADIVETRFDAIVCDEGQDVPEDFWMPLQRILSDFDESPFYIFRDDNQDIYHRSSSNIFTEAPFQLSLNCRNTAEIHELAYQYYKGAQVSAPLKSGLPIIELSARGFAKQAELILREVRQLLQDPVLGASQVVVLVASRQNGDEMKAQLSRAHISKTVTWTANHRRNENEVLVESVRRFKGLESPIIILWFDDMSSNGVEDEDIYVGASRARSLLITVSSDGAGNVV